MATMNLFRHRFYNNDGTVASGGKVYTYQAGTTTPVSTYTDATGTVANTNPIILDSKGEADIWITGIIKVNVLQSDNTQITGYPVDNIDSTTVTMWNDRGNFDASVNTYPTTGGSGAGGAILTGDVWTISVVATSGPLNTQLVGTTVRALTDTPGQTVGNWTILDVGLGASNAAAVAAAAAAAVSETNAGTSETNAATSASNAGTSETNAAASEAAALAYAQAMSLNATTDTSASSNDVTVGAKTFTVTAGKSFVPGMFLVIADTNAPSTNSMYGQITSYSGTTLIVNVLSVLGSGTLSAWTISQTSAANLNVDTANTVNSGMVTVASHATTGDIFAAAGNSISWTGTATTTIFPNAPKAGMTRTLYCAAACAFTAGANLLIEGFPSGGTATMAAGAIVNVLAITTTQFKITYSVSGTFTATGTGFTVNPTATALYSITNGRAAIYIASGALVGTSNATTFTITGLPSCLTPSAIRRCGLQIYTDNDASVGGIWDVSGTTITLHKSTSAYSEGWTASAGKRLYSTDFVYSLG